MIDPGFLYLRIRVRMARGKSAVLHRPFLKTLGRKSFIDRPKALTGMSNVSIGDGVSIRWGARIEAHARFAHRTPVLTIGSHTNIEQNVHIMCQSRITIGNHVSITGGCAIVDVVHPFDALSTKVGDAILDEDTFVDIGDNVFLGYGSVILPNVTIGAGAIIGANSVVRSDIPERAIAAGCPAKVIRFRL
jgi:acetyltransferase-like isoleucine patch superfamily enzyme